MQAALLIGGVMLLMAYAGMQNTVEKFTGRKLSQSDECVDDGVTVHAESHYPSSAILEGNAGIPIQIVVMLYMFVGLAVICDEYFEVALDRICIFLKLSDDVAGATFMAAGSSAPELFTSLMGVFVAQSDVGVGTIVGSAVFNVLIIIGACAFAADGIQLSWWPLARDSVFYCLTIIVLIACVLDQTITPAKSIICLVMYMLYIVLMKFNHQIERKVKGLHATAKDRRLPMDREIAKVCNSNAMQMLIALIIVGNLVILIIDFTCETCNKEVLVMLNLSFSIIFICEMFFKVYGMGFFPYWADPANAFDGILVGLIIGEFILQAASESSGSSIASNLRTVRLFRVFRVFRALRCCKLIIGAQGKATSGSVNSYLRKKNQVLPTSPEEEIDRELEMEQGVDKEANAEKPTSEVEEDPAAKKDIKGKDGDEDDEDDDDDDDEPANPYEVPDSTGSKIFWALTLPMTVLMFYTVPDCRKPNRKNWFFATFMMSIFWIGALSFLMVWMAEAFGNAVGIPPPVMGLTILAAGTSIPDTIASVNVAKAGKGDMAVSNSIGSNVFDILIGLGIPWFISTVCMGQPVRIVSDTLTVSVMILFITVALVVLAIHISDWFLTRKIGYLLFFTYFLYAGQAVLTEYGYILSDC